MDDGVVLDIAATLGQLVGLLAASTEDGGLALDVRAELLEAVAGQLEILRRWLLDSLTRRGPSDDRSRIVWRLSQVWAQYLEVSRDVEAELRRRGLREARGQLS